MNRRNMGMIVKVGVATITILAAGFARQAQSDTTQTGNLVTNPGIEKGSGGSPQDWQTGVLPSTMSLDGVVDYIWHAKIGHTGKRSLCFKKTQDRYFPVAQWIQAISYNGDAKTLDVSVWIKAREVGKATLTVQCLDASGTSLSRDFAIFVGAKNPGDAAVTADWKQYKSRVTIPANTTEIQIIPEMYGPGVAWFDDFDIRYAK